MHRWNDDELRKIADADDLHVSPFREDGRTYGTPTWIWSVAVDGALYVRGYNGQNSRWYGAAAQQKAGRIVAAGLTKEVAFEPVDGPILDLDRRGLSLEVSRQSISRTDDQCACPVRNHTDRAAAGWSTIMKQFLVYGASMLAVALGGAAVAQDLGGQYVQVAEIEVDPAQLDAYRVAVQEQIGAAIREEPGVLVLYAVSEKDDPARVKVFEIYRDRKAYEAHLGSDHFKKYKATVEKMVKSLKLVQATPIALGAKTK